MTAAPHVATAPHGVLVVTDRRQAPADLVTQVAGAVAGGARWVLLREKDLPHAARRDLADQLREVLAPVGGRLVVAGPDPLGGDAVHLAATDPWPATPGGAAPHRPAPVGRSVHDAAEFAAAAGCAYVTVSPVFASVSKPGYGPPLGIGGLAALAARAPCPVLALGGVETPQQAARCAAAGAAGVAVMGTVMRAADPAAAVAALAAGFRTGAEGAGQAAVDARAAPRRQAKETV